ncbi:MAG: transcriptional regulator NrdR [Candidatus Aminicenantes bacterium]|nr:transcriptional regulator NrdR [Candidatus Aminicenantes bacterium]
MKCPYCDHAESKVIDSRESKNGFCIRRRRECLACKRRFTTYEKIEEIPYMVVKKDGKRQPFDNQKLLRGLLKACEKRPVPLPKLEEIVEQIETKLQEKPEKEMKAADIGRFVMDRLKELDKVAYVRFASVYREFRDVLEFKHELEKLLEEK